MTDTQTGLRAFQTQMIPFMLGIEGDRYEYEMNMLTQASQKYLITEVPIETIYIDDNASSHFRPIRDSLMIYKNLFKFALASFGGFVIDYLVYAMVLLTFSWAPTTIRLLLANSLGRTMGCWSRCGATAARLGAAGGVGPGAAGSVVLYVGQGAQAGGRTAHRHHKAYITPLASTALLILVSGRASPGALHWPPP